MNGMNGKLKIAAVILAGLMASPGLLAGDLEWSGLYRFEGNQINYPSLDTSSGKRKEYGVHTLIMRPKIVAADGLYINAQLNIFNSDDYNQLGAYFGNSLGTTPPTTSSNNSNTASENQKSESLAVTQFYLTSVQEYGRLIVGRAPLQFGLGITHNAGAGLFDHYSDTRDLVGYKIMMGNFYYFPSYAKIDEGDLSSYDDVNEWNHQLVYENPDSDASMGVHYQNRKATRGGNDVPAATLATGGAVTGQYNAKNYNVFYKKETDNYNVGFEVAQQGGDTGVNAVGDNMSLDGFAVALEYEWHPKENKKVFGFKAGMATGDDPATNDSYEGFIFDRNYDVAMFLFNHNMGQADLFHTALIGRSATSVNNSPDTEAISNVSYFSPYMKYRWSDKWSMSAVLTTGILSEDKVGTNVSTEKVDTDLGYELDLSMIYTVTDKITWVNQFGYFAPGDAWKVGTNNFDTDSIYGFVTKAAVSF